MMKRISCTLSVTSSLTDGVCASTSLPPLFSFPPSQSTLLCSSSAHVSLLSSSDKDSSYSSSLSTPLRNSDKCGPQRLPLPASTPVSLFPFFSNLSKIHIRCYTSDDGPDDSFDAKNTKDKIHDDKDPMKNQGAPPEIDNKINRMDKMKEDEGGKASESLMKTYAPYITMPTSKKIFKLYRRELASDNEESPISSPPDALSPIGEDPPEKHNISTPTSPNTGSSSSTSSNTHQAKGTDDTRTIYADDIIQEGPNASVPKEKMTNPFTGGYSYVKSSPLFNWGFGIERGIVGKRKVYLKDEAKFLKFVESVRRGKGILNLNGTINPRLLKLYSKTLFPLINAGVSDVVSVTKRYLERFYVNKFHYSMEMGLHMEYLNKSRPFEGLDGESQSNETDNNKEAYEVGNSENIQNIVLNQEQLTVVDLAAEGYNLYIGGSAGTGKSVILRALKNYLINRLGLRVGMCASTGVAAAQNGCTTFHSLFHMSVQNSFHNRELFLKYDVIIIDEVSMFNSDFISNLDKNLRIANGCSPLPFGGVQIILCGDFMQLSFNGDTFIDCPVFRESFVMLRLTTVVRQRDESYINQLRSVRRGEMPEDLLAKILVNGVRKPQQHLKVPVTNTLSLSPSNQTKEEVPSQQKEKEPESEMMEATLNGRQIQLKVFESVSYVPGATNLLPSNLAVDAANRAELNKLPGQPIEYTPLRVAPTVAEKELCTDHVIIKVNQGFNYMTFKGRLVEFFKERVPEIENVNVHLYWLNETMVCFRVYAPNTCLNRADAAEELRKLVIKIPSLLSVERDTLHASFSCFGPVDGPFFTTTDMHFFETERSFSLKPVKLKVGTRVMMRQNCNALKIVNGMLGTVVSFMPFSKLKEGHTRMRVNTSLKGSAGHCSTMYAEHFKAQMGIDLIIPVVEFANGTRHPITPCIFDNSFSPTSGFMQPVINIPLQPAYAITIHKVQGLTLNGRVHLNLMKSSPIAHLLYVALSRVRKPEQLSVESYNTAHLITSKDALLFDESLPSPSNAFIPPLSPVAVWKRFPFRNTRKAKVTKNAKKEAQRQAVDMMLALGAPTVGRKPQGAQRASPSFASSILGGNLYEPKKTNTSSNIASQYKPSYHDVGPVSLTPQEEESMMRKTKRDIVTVTEDRIDTDTGIPQVRSDKVSGDSRYLRETDENDDDDGDGGDISQFF